MNNKTISLIELLELIDELRNLKNVQEHDRGNFKYSDDWYRLEKLSNMTFILENEFHRST